MKKQENQSHTWCDLSQNKVDDPLIVPISSGGSYDEDNDGSIFIYNKNCINDYNIDSNEEEKIYMECLPIIKNISKKLPHHSMKEYLWSDVVAG